MKSHLLKNQGSYGKVYLATSNKRIFGYKKCIIKVNRDKDVCLGHEYRVMCSLARHASLSAFFCRALGFVELPDRQLLYMEQVDHECTLDDAIDSMSYEAKANIYQHLVCILQMAQEKCRFTHYDLHFNNILLQRHGGKVTYIIKHKKIQVPIINYRPVIIDFGFSHVDGTSGFRGPLTQTHYYMNPLVFCEHYDIYSLRKRMSREGLVFEAFDSDILKSRLTLSLFDYLCHALGFLHPFPISKEVDGNDDDWRTVSPWKSVRTERENALFSLLFRGPPARIRSLIEEYLKIYCKHYNSKQRRLKVACTSPLLK